MREKRAGVASGRAVLASRPPSPHSPSQSPLAPPFSCVYLVASPRPCICPSSLLAQAHPLPVARISCPRRAPAPPCCCAAAPAAGSPAPALRPRRPHRASHAAWTLGCQRGEGAASPKNHASFYAHTSAGRFWRFYCTARYFVRGCAGQGGEEEKPRGTGCTHPPRGQTGPRMAPTLLRQHPAVDIA